MMTKKSRRKWIFVTLVATFISIFFLDKNDFFNSRISSSDYVSVFDPNKESCIQCHAGTKGYSEYHNPELIGCASCHLGHPEHFDKVESHEGMVLIPGNLNDAAETCGKCHIEELNKIENSLMTTNSGLIAVDKYIYGEAESPDHQYHIKDLGFSAADKHIRDLCANCHLGAQKLQFGPVDQLSRGGGCNACHLNYTEESKMDLKIYLESDKTKLPLHHPSSDIFVKNEHCFGCHSRSSRISTNYEGWQETLLDEIPSQSDAVFKEMQDKRIYKYIEEDIHHTNGLLCVDCHSSHEVMGDGKQYTHEEQAVKIQCSDCHFEKTPNTTVYDSLDVESLKVFLHRDYKHSSKEILIVKKDSHPLVNTYIDEVGAVFLIGKADGKLHSINPQSEVCSRDNVHKNVSCSTCHSSWTSKCIGCHNEYDSNAEGYDLLDKKPVKGQWKEFVAEFGSVLPSLGVRIHKDGYQIEPAIPGMILTIDKGSFTGESESINSFHRLYALNSPHTTGSKARDCKSCHNSSTAIGYGDGELTFYKSNPLGTWRFEPTYALNENDGLPEDAWIPFMESIPTSTVNTTRSDFRPMNLKEQKRMLLVGTCLNCHDATSDVMQESLILGIDSLIDRIQKECILPNWDN